jgi:hypothetical protein
MAAQPPDPPIRLSLKYSMNPVDPAFVHNTPLYRQGLPLELNDANSDDVSSIACGVKPKTLTAIAAGAPSPVGDGEGTIGASIST